MSVLDWAVGLAAFSLGTPLIIGVLAFFLFGLDRDDVRRLGKARRPGVSPRDPSFEIELNEPR